MAYVNRRTKQLERTFNDLYRPVYTGTKTARIGE
jgi:hypothetical protein